MSEKKVRKTRAGQGDGRSFVELWYSMPQAGRQMLTDELKRKGVRNKTIFDWYSGKTPRQSNMEKLQRALLKCFGLRTRPYVLFPDKETTRELLERFAPKEKGWDGKLEWPSLQEQKEDD